MLTNKVFHFRSLLSIIFCPDWSCRGSGTQFPSVRQTSIEPLPMAANAATTAKTTRQPLRLLQDQPRFVQAENLPRVQTGPAAKTIHHLALNSLSWRDLERTTTDFTTLTQNTNTKPRSSFTFSSLTFKFRATNASGGSGPVADGGWVTASMLEPTPALPTSTRMWCARTRRSNVGWIRKRENTSSTFATTAQKDANTLRTGLLSAAPRLHRPSQVWPATAKMQSSWTTDTSRCARGGSPTEPGPALKPIEANLSTFLVKHSLS